MMYSQQQICVWMDSQLVNLTKFRKIYNHEGFGLQPQFQIEHKTIVEDENGECEKIMTIRMQHII